jgi:long-chain acyl-CoA synthetase
MIRNVRCATRSLPRRIARFSSSVPILPIQPLEFKTLIELHEKATQAYSTNPMYGTKVGGAYEWMNYSEFDVEVSKCRIVLKEHHIGKDDKVALISNNRTEWAVMKFATVGLGGQIVPM